MMELDKLAAITGVVTSLAAAGLWLRGSLIDVPNNIDTIVKELQRIGRLNAWAAWAALIAAVCAAYSFWRQLH